MSSLPTLVLLVPFNTGTLLISDRQSTKYGGTKEPWDKIYFLEKSDAVIGLSGSSEGTRLIAQFLKNPTDQPFFEQYRAAYQQLRNFSLTSEEMQIEALCVIKQFGSIEAYKFTRDLYNLLTLRKPIGIGSGEQFIRPHLMLDTTSISLEKAIEFGKTLIEYASRVDTGVGSPSQFGFCLATVSSVEEISCKSLDPEQVSLDKVLYRFT